jgi:hypothetical protein
VLVWGAGTLARRLLACSQLSEINIAAFVDSDPQLHGQFLAQRPILNPEELVSRTESILICSVPFKMEICSRIDELGLPNRVIPLGL